jgi:predicted DNA-binding transcriptional regulator AlpA
MESESPFLLPAEVDAITRLHDLTRRRMEARGLFPKRVRIGARKTAHRRSDIETWMRDPDAWRRSHAAGGEVA